MANESCPNCGADVVVRYGPDIRFDPPCSKPMMWRAECSGNCLNPSWTSFTRESALRHWNDGVAAGKPAPSAPEGGEQ
jgi:hypothetical protein